MTDDDAKTLFLAVVQRAMLDVAHDPLGKHIETAPAYDWFWSESFQWWCSLLGWDDEDYKFKALRDKIRAMRVSRTRSVSRHNPGTRRTVRDL